MKYSILSLAVIAFIGVQSIEATSISSVVRRSPAGGYDSSGSSAPSASGGDSASSCEGGSDGCGGSSGGGEDAPACDGGETGSCSGGAPSTGSETKAYR
ncbi:hypothetical protein DSO57_1016679 [Entomophthora muscae]|uniref:Uncharacterized protein n=1 Tax=Entomophthora muscae TaxID=34485 RepID=A0ACC2URS3_9FUNG|nr:hypothetical protein DSO57_1016679 [Entomophthora muscae]